MIGSATRRQRGKKMFLAKLGINLDKIVLNMVPRRIKIKRSLRACLKRFRLYILIKKTKMFN